MRKHLFAITLIALTLLSWIIAWSYLPEDVPMHWNAAGEVDGYMSKAGGLIFDVAMMTFIAVILTLSPKIDPKRENYEKFAKSYEIMKNVSLLFFFIINIMTLFSSLGYDVPMGEVIAVMIGILFIIIGNYMQRSKQTFFFGLRTPWTLSSEEVWRKTHRLGGRLFMLGGLLIIGTGFLPGAWKIGGLVGTVIMITVVPLIYSYIIYKKESVHD